MFSSESDSKIKSHIPESDPHTWSTTSPWRAGYRQLTIVDVEALHSFCIQSKTFISKKSYLFAGAIEHEFGVIVGGVPEYNTQCSYKGAVSLIGAEYKQGIHVHFRITDEIEDESRLSLHSVAEHVVVWQYNAEVGVSSHVCTSMMIVRWPLYRRKLTIIISKYIVQEYRGEISCWTALYTVESEEVQQVINEIITCLYNPNGNQTRGFFAAVPTSFHYSLDSPDNMLTINALYP